MAHAQQLVFVAWAVLVAAMLGLGLLERRLTGAPLRGGRDLWSAIWTGWALMLAGLQIWHLFLPVDDGARIAVAVVAAAGGLAAGTAPWRILVASLPWSLVPAGATLAAAAVLSTHSLAGPRFGDTGMYLIPTIHWYESYAAVPGLANLFVPLGHNLSYFLYGALLDGGPFFHRIYHVVNSVLVMVLVARGIFSALALVRGTGRPVAHAFHALALLPVAELAFGLFLTSPSPDTAVFLFGIVLAGELVELVSDPEPVRGDVVRLAFLCAVGLTLKLSIAGLSLSAAAVGLLWWTLRSGRSLPAMLQAALLCLLATLPVVGAWLVRNAISSGYPLYPASLFPLDVDWIARRDATAWIQAPMAMAPWHTIFTQPEWWKSRLLSLGWWEDDVRHPLVLVAAGAALFVLLRPLAWRRGASRAAPLVLLAVPLVAFVFCFANTPMPRYQGATIWIFGMLLAVSGLTALMSGRAARLVCPLISAAALAGALLPVYRGASLWADYDDFEGASPPRLHEKTLPSGLVVRVPENQVCWYAPLPCTPEPHDGLRLRVPGDLASGFAIDAGN